jgi:hypothetical protein
MDFEFGEYLFGDALLFVVRPFPRRILLLEEGLHVCVIRFEEIDRIRHGLLLPPKG